MTYLAFYTSLLVGGVFLGLFVRVMSAASGR
jgi:hypothetical protein